jgi:hypothetical protein
VADFDDPRPAYFGEPWDAPALDGAVQVPTPEWQACALCGEPVMASDRGWIRGHLTAGPDGRPVTRVVPHHAECELLSVAGHLVGVCSCTGWDSGRPAAREAWRRLTEHGGVDHG